MRLGRLAQDMQSTLNADMIAASQAQFRLARRRALADKFQSDYTKACNTRTNCENSRKVYGLDDALAYIEKMITPRQDAFHAQGVGQIMSGTLVATNDLGLIVLAKRQGS